MKKFWAKFYNIVGWGLVVMGFFGVIFMVAISEVTRWETLALFTSILWGFFLWHLRDHEERDKK